MIHKLAVAAAAVLAFTAASAAQAQSCPADLSSLSSQITDSGLNAALGASIDEVIAQAGGLAQAIASAETSLAQLQAFRAKLGEDDVAQRLYTDQALLIVNAELDALQCRQAEQ